MTSHEAHCLQNAVSFSAVRGASPFNRTRKDFLTLAEAIKHGANFGDNRTMIYAITDTGSSAHITNA